MMTKSFRIAPGGTLRGSLRVPGDKSISHRAIMLGAIADGVTRVDGFLEGEDALATMNIFRALGVTIDGPHQGRVVVHGVGLHGLRAPVGKLDCGNSGTSMRLLCGLLAGQNFNCELIGDESLSRRPMRRVAAPLASMGARIQTEENGTPPVRIHGSPALQAISYTMPVASAQVKSSIILAGLYAKGTTCITEPAPTRDHTERMLRSFSYPITTNDAKICVEGGGTLRATDISVPADISSAAFFMVGASITPGSDITLEEVGINPTRTGVIEILRLMGADIELTNVRENGNEPVADIRVRYAPLHGIQIPPALVPLAIDEFPVLFVAAANAVGETLLTDAHELRVKESDRIQVMAEGLNRLGIKATPTTDGIHIVGGRYTGGEINSHGDHRIAMSFSMAALRASSEIIIHDCDNVATSFPGFVNQAASVGLKIKE